MKPLEQDIEIAIQEGLFYRHRVILAKTDAGGANLRKLNQLPVVFDIPLIVRQVLDLPHCLPWGISLAIKLPPTFPDLMGRDCHERIVFIEVKRPGKKPTAGQQAFLAARRAEGHIAFWADSLEMAEREYLAQTMKGAA